MNRAAKHAPDAGEIQDRAGNVIPFPKRERPPEGPVSREGLQWYVDHPKEAAAAGIEPWRLKIVAYRLSVLDALGPEPEPKPYTPEEIAKIVAEVEAATGKKVVRVTTTTDVLRRDDSADDDPPGEAGKTASNRVPFHEATAIYPMLDGEPLKRLKADIKARGRLIKKIVRCKNEDGQWVILDGRARYDICLEFGIEPDFIDSDKIDDPETYLVSVNLHRVLSDLHRALIAARTVTAERGGDRNTLAKKSDTSNSGIPTFGGKQKQRTAAEAAAIYRLGLDSVKRARAILDRSEKVPEFVAAIERADHWWVSIDRAYGVVIPTKVEELDGLTSEEKQRQWLKDNKLFKRAAKPPLSPFDSFARKWRYLSEEEQQRFAIDFAMTLLIDRARRDGVTEIAIGEARIIIDP
jgi:hypothetical protein